MSAASSLQALLAARWADHPDLAEVRVRATERALDDIREPTLILRVVSIGHATLAQGLREVGVISTLVSPFQDLDAAAEQLEQLVADVLDDFQQLPDIITDGATSTVYSNRLSYDIPLTLYAKRDTTT